MIEPAYKREKVQAQPIIWRKSCRFGEEAVDQQQPCFVIIVAGRPRFITKHSIQFRALGKNIAPVNEVSEDRLVDKHAAAKRADPVREIHVGSRAKPVERRVVREQKEGIAAVAVARGRRPNPFVIERRYEMDFLREQAAKIYCWPFCTTSMMIRPKDITVSFLTPPDAPVKFGSGAHDDLIIGDLQHVPGGESNMDPQGQMHKNMGLDAMREQQIVRIKEDH